MCGITGYIDYRHQSSKEILEAMTHCLKHRGPDGSDTKLFNENEFQLGLGHRRLSIIDLSKSAKQPMSFNSFCITYNGEIYNYKEITKELELLGHNFNSLSDTEMILHAYAQWGSSCLDKFIGMFAFVIYDQNKQEVFCARDRAGVKPFFYYWKDDLFLFGSELKTFHEHHGFQKEINLDAVAAFMQYGNVPTPHCIFKNSFKLKPGYFLHIDLQKKTINEKKYWSVYDSYNKSKIDISFNEAKSKTESILKSAFDYRMIADVPVGVFLSGGYDSASVAAILQKDRTEKLKTYTIAVPDIGLNEAPYAKEVAKHLGTDHHEYECTQKEALELLDDLPYYYDEPFADSSAIPTTLVAKMAKKDVSVALSADAGDEIFAGYNRYDDLIRYSTKFNKIPSFARKSTAGLMDILPSDKIPILKDKYNFPNRYEKLKEILKNPSEKQIMLSLSQQFTDNKIKELMHLPTNRLDTAYHNNELKKEHSSLLSYIMAIDYQTYLMDDIMQKVDRASMSVSLEGREPFLDHRVIEWAAALPDAYKYYKGEKKHILKEIVHQYIPKSLMDRPKMGFAIPIDDWMLTVLKDKVIHYLSEDNIEKQRIFNADTVRELKKEFFNGKKELSYKIWYILMFQMWYEKWMK